MDYEIPPLDYDELLKHKIITEDTEVNSETVVLWGLRLWQIIAVVVTGVTIITVIFCSVCKCRIPRTRKEIEERQRRKKEAKLVRINQACDEETRVTEVTNLVETSLCNNDKTQTRKKMSNRRDMMSSSDQSTFEDGKYLV